MSSAFISLKGLLTRAKNSPQTVQAKIEEPPQLLRVHGRTAQTPDNYPPFDPNFEPTYPSPGNKSRQPYELILGGFECD